MEEKQTMEEKKKPTMSGKTLAAGGSACRGAVWSCGRSLLSASRPALFSWPVAASRRRAW